MKVDFRKIAEDAVFNVKCEEHDSSESLSLEEIKEIEEYLKGITDKSNGSLLEGIAKLTSEESSNVKRK